MVTPNRRRAGLSLIEVVVSIALVSVLGLTTIDAATALARRQNETNDRLVAHQISTMMMDEITAQSFEDPDQPIFGTETGESARADFDDVDDYHGWSQTSPTDRAGYAIDGSTGWNLRVAIDPIEIDGTGVWQVVADPSNLKRIAVTVVSTEGQSFTQQRLVGRIGDSVADTSRSWMGEITVTRNGQDQQRVVPLENKPPRHGAW